MCDYSPFRERAMTVSEDKSWWCDPCIAPIVKALNDAGLRTVASCCGHGQRPGNIFLANGTELTIRLNPPKEGRVMRSRDEARAWGGERMSGNRLVFTVFAVSVVSVLFGAFAHIMAAVTR